MLVLKLCCFFFKVPQYMAGIFVNIRCSNIQQSFHDDKSNGAIDSHLFAPAYVWEYCHSFLYWLWLLVVVLQCMHNLTDCVKIKKTMDPHSLEHLLNSLLLVERPWKVEKKILELCTGMIDTLLICIWCPKMNTSIVNVWILIKLCK